MNTHNVREPTAELTGVQHEHHARIMMEQKEHTREACTKVSGTRAYTDNHAYTHNDNDAPTLHCYYLASTPYRSAEILTVPLRDHRSRESFEWYLRDSRKSAAHIAESVGTFFLMEGEKAAAFLLLHCNFLLLFLLFIIIYFFNYDIFKYIYKINK